MAVLIFLLLASITSETLGVGASIAQGVEKAPGDGEDRAFLKKSLTG